MIVYEPLSGGPQVFVRSVVFSQRLATWPTVIYAVVDGNLTRFDWTLGPGLFNVRHPQLFHVWS